MNRKLDVGSEIESRCGRCKMVLNHSIVAMVDDKPKRVRCLTCNSDHNHRLPKVSKPKKVRSRSSKTATSRASNSAKWQTNVANWDDAAARRYSIYESFDLNDRVNHKTFGKGVVIDIPGPDRMITLFETGEKMLMQGKIRPR